MALNLVEHNFSLVVHDVDPAKVEPLRARGAAATFKACRDLFEAMGTKLFHVGGAGQGLAMKLVNNMLIQTSVVAIAEALVMGVKAGLDPWTIWRRRSPSSSACRCSWPT